MIPLNDTLRLCTCKQTVVSGCQGLDGRRRIWAVTTNVCGAPFWGDENILEPYSNDGCNPKKELAISGCVL